MVLTIERNSPIPLNAKVEHLLRQLARQPEYQNGSLLRRHIVFDPGRRPFEFAEVCYVSDRFTLTLDMRRGEE